MLTQQTRSTEDLIILQAYSVYVCVCAEDYFLVHTLATLMLALSTYYIDVVFRNGSKDISRLMYSLTGGLPKMEFYCMLL